MITRWKKKKKKMTEFQAKFVATNRLFLMPIIYCFKGQSFFKVYKLTF